MTTPRPAEFVRDRMRDGATPEEATTATQTAFPFLTEEELADAFDSACEMFIAEAEELRRLAVRRRH